MRYFTLIAVVLAAPALADGPIVRATGSATRELAPDTVRATTYVVEQGTNLQAVMTTATQRAAAMETALKALSPLSVVVSPPRVATDASMTSKTFARALKRLKQIKTGGLEEQVTVAIALTGDWPLTAGDASARVASSVELSRKIASVGRSAHTTDGEAEKDREEQDSGESESGFNEMAMKLGQGVKPGAVMLGFVKVVPRELVDAATAEALKAARESAQKLAAIAGHDLGPLQSLATTATGGADEDEGSRVYHPGMRAPSAGSSTLPHWELVTPTFTKLKIRVDAETTWALKPR